MLMRGAPAVATQERLNLPLLRELRPAGAFELPPATHKVRKKYGQVAFPVKLRFLGAPLWQRRSVRVA
eukprot:11191697-Lingulodinium_polyedra.AAC.1